MSDTNLHTCKKAPNALYGRAGIACLECDREAKQSEMIKHFAPTRFNNDPERLKRLADAEDKIDPFAPVPSPVSEEGRAPIAWQIKAGRRIYLFAKEPKVEPVYEYGGQQLGAIFFDECPAAAAPPEEEAVPPVEILCTRCSRPPEEHLGINGEFCPTAPTEEEERRGFIDWAVGEGLDTQQSAINNRFLNPDTKKFYRGWQARGRLRKGK